MHYTAWVQVKAQLQALQEHAQIIPHQRSKDKRVQLMILSVLREATLRLERKLCDVKQEVKFSFKQNEALALIVAYDRGWILYSIPVSEIVNLIDKAA